MLQSLWRNLLTEKYTMNSKYIPENVQAKTKQINIRVSEEAYEAFDKVRDDMYVKGKILTITDAINHILVDATLDGKAWLDENIHAKNINKRRVKPASKSSKSKANAVVA